MHYLFFSKLLSIYLIIFVLALDFPDAIAVSTSATGDADASYACHNKGERRQTRR